MHILQLDGWFGRVMSSIPQFAFLGRNGMLHGGTYSMSDISGVPPNEVKSDGRPLTAIVLCDSLEAANEYASNCRGGAEIVHYADPRALRRLLEDTLSRGMRFICSPVAGEDRATLRPIADVIAILRRHESN
jgi:hypothetical protein